MTDAPNPIRIGIVDDHQLVREGLAGLLAPQSDLKVVSCCATAEEALKAVGAQTIDVILLDLRLAESSGISLFEELLKTGFEGRILVVAATVSDEEAFRLMSSGASGIVLKTAPFEVLLTAIRKVAEGELWCDQQFLKKILGQTARFARQSQAEVFTAREKAVLRHLLNGLSNKEIGGRMDLPESSVKSVMQCLFDKTGVRNRAQLVRVALERFQSEL